jgi:hypothetical protein
MHHLVDIPGGLLELLRQEEGRRLLPPGQGVLRADVRELAILTAARGLRVAYEWETHQENARRAGLSATLIADVLAGHDLSADPPYAKVQALARHFLRLERLPQPLQDELVAALGLPGFMEAARLHCLVRQSFRYRASVRRPSRCDVDVTAARVAPALANTGSAFAVTSRAPAG